MPWLCEGGEVLAVGGPGDEDAEEAAGEDVEGVVARVHDAGGGDEGGAEGGDEDEEGLPDLAAAVEDVELAGEVEREVEEPGEGGWGVVVRCLCSMGEGVCEGGDLPLL